MTACQFGHKEIVKFLLTQKGIDLTIQNAIFFTRFHNDFHDFCLCQTAYQLAKNDEIRSLFPNPK